MTSLSQSQSDRVKKTLHNLFLMELKICHILGIETHNQNTNDQEISSDIAQNVQKLLIQIYESLLTNSNGKINQNKMQQRKSEIDDYEQDLDQYQKIEDLLQKEQNKTRILLRKQFEFKQYQNSVIDELNQEKAINRQLNSHINKLNQELQQKTMEIMHLKNFSKSYQRATIDISQMDKHQKNKTNNKLSSNNLSSSLLNQNYIDQKKLQNLKQQFKSICTTGRKSRELKEQAMLAIYNSHKKRTIDSIGGTQRVKKPSILTKNSGKKTIQKLGKYVQNSQKKSIYFRRKSQQIPKKTPSQKQGKQSSKITRKKTKQIKKDFLTNYEFK